MSDMDALALRSPLGDADDLYFKYQMARHPSTAAGIVQERPTGSASIARVASFALPERLTTKAQRRHREGSSPDIPLRCIL